MVLNYCLPANNFGKQEPGSDEEMLFCDSKYATSFILMSKINVKGKNIRFMSG